MNIPSTIASIDVAKVGDRLILNWNVTGPTGSAGLDSGSVVINADQLDHWLALLSPRIMAKLK